MSKPTPRPPLKPPRPRSSASSIDQVSEGESDLVRQQNDNRRTIAIIILLALLFLLLLLFLFFSTALVGRLRSGTAGDGQSSTGSGIGNSDQAAAVSSDLNGSQQPESEVSTPSEKALLEPVAEAASPPKTKTPNIESGAKGDGNKPDPPPMEVTMAGETESPKKGGRVFTIPGGEFFGIKSQGNKFVYVIDSSSSMSGSPFSRAKQELKLSIDALADTQSFSVFFFSTECYPMFYPNTDSRLKMATAPNRGKAEPWIDQFPADGGTDPEHSIELALGLKPDVIYLLTDGGFDASIVNRVTKLNRGRVVINSIGFSSSADETVLKAMAKKNRGSYRRVR